MALSIEIEVPQAVILTKERKNKNEEKMIRLEPRLDSIWPAVLQSLVSLKISTYSTNNKSANQTTMILKLSCVLLFLYN